MVSMAARLVNAAPKAAAASASGAGAASRSPWPLFVVTVLQMSVLQSICQFLPLWAVHGPLKLRPTTAGLLLSLFDLAQCISSPIVGRALDRAGTRRPMVLAALLGASSVACLVLRWAAALRSWPLLFIAVTVWGLTEHNMLACTVLVADMAGHSDPATVFGRNTFAFNAGFAIGPLLGGTLPFATLCSMAACVSCCLALFVTRFVSDPVSSSSSSMPRGATSEDSKAVCDTEMSSMQPPSNQAAAAADCLEAAQPGGQELSLRSEDNIPSSKKSCLVRARGRTRAWWRQLTGYRPRLARIVGESEGSALAVIVLAMICENAAVHMMRANYALILRNGFNSTRQETGRAMSLLGALGMVSSLGAANLSRRLGGAASCTQALMWGLTASFLGLLVAPSLTMFLVASSPLKVSSSMLRVTFNTLLVQNVPANEIGSLIGSLQSAMALLKTSSPYCSGVCLEFHPRAPLLVSTMMAILGSLLALRLTGSSEASAAKETRRCI
eukprot:TRINITY_DN50708_c0_g1_i1.p1 TRINITY_DN50708_c0_g1~~TRINITY_DN50708_c0_g1_i1.p1  ORF type:complete len:499 (+),score=98.03 TRINITY_DN50708_c0_g1_i1:127-1623(+)